MSRATNMLGEYRIKLEYDYEDTPGVKSHRRTVQTTSPWVKVSHSSVGWSINFLDVVWTGTTEDLLKAPNASPFYLRQPMHRFVTSANIQDADKSHFMHGESEVWLGFVNGHLHLGHNLPRSREPRPETYTYLEIEDSFGHRTVSGTRPPPDAVKITSKDRSDSLGTMRTTTYGYPAMPGFGDVTFDLVPSNVPLNVRE